MRRQNNEKLLRLVNKALSNTQLPARCHVLVLTVGLLAHHDSTLLTVSECLHAFTWFAAVIVSPQTVLHRAALAADAGQLCAQLPPQPATPAGAVTPVVRAVEGGGQHRNHTGRLQASHGDLAA